MLQEVRQILIEVRQILIETPDSFLKVKGSVHTGQSRDNLKDSFVDIFIVINLSKTEITRTISE